MFVNERKTTYVKVVKKNPHLQKWPHPAICDRGKTLHIERHFITLSKDERVYQFIPYRTSFFLIDFEDRDGRYIFTKLDGFQAKLAQAMFRDKKTPKIAC